LFSYRYILSILLILSEKENGIWFSFFFDQTGRSQLGGAREKAVQNKVAF
jgi:hypothetical protein